MLLLRLLRWVGAAGRLISSCDCVLQAAHEEFERGEEGAFGFAPVIAYCSKRKYAFGKVYRKREVDNSVNQRTRRGVSASDMQFQNMIRVYATLMFRIWISKTTKQILKGFPSNDLASFYCSISLNTILHLVRASNALDAFREHDATIGVLWLAHSHATSRDGVRNSGHAMHILDV